jgi:hypothetical protein
MRSFLLHNFCRTILALTRQLRAVAGYSSHKLQRALQPPLQQACKQGRNYREAARRAAMPAAQASKGGQAQAAEWPVMEQEERMVRSTPGVLGVPVSQPSHNGPSWLAGGALQRLGEGV